ncbi:MAG: 1-acyl-sn-glycerol-3-phosphate acyltransferase [Alphaproteobacteria bacterium]|nr:1-acyl-sn-glycerol-3-phosphate acyltransferase [Alphaproteobacteria bacterium]
MDDSPGLRRWLRRALTIPAVHLGLWGVLGLLPLLLPLALILDAVDARRRRRLPLTRGLLFLCWYLACECAGLQGAWWTWLATGGGLWREGLYRSNLVLQRVWVDALWLGVRTLMGIRLTVEGADAVAPPGDGRMLVLLRHSSLPDVLLPGLAFANPRRIPLAYVLKVEVCWSPCLDVVGHRLSNAFVRRGSGDPAREIARVVALHDRVRPGEGLVIYPEGTRFSQGKRARLLARLDETGDTAGADRVRRYTHVLPPRRGGPSALLARRRSDDDVYIVAHAGTEAAMDARGLARGGLVGAEFRVRIWRIPGDRVPRDADAVMAWLDGWWERVDAWVGAQGT